MGCVHGSCCKQYEPSSQGKEPRDSSVSEANARNHHGGDSLHMLTGSSVELAHVPSHNYTLRYSFSAQRGYYPDAPDKENQDSFIIETQIKGNSNLHFFGVFDGHGHFGTECSNFVKRRLFDLLINDPNFSDEPDEALTSAFLAANSELHSFTDIDDSMSGTTAITVLVHGNTLFVANVGDSRAVIALKGGNSILAEDLSKDQTPYRKDECERVKSCGARVLSVDQLEGLKDPKIQDWGNEENGDGDPPRLWMPNVMYPGTAFTRSVGDSVAEKIGVIAEPEILKVQLTPNHLFFVIASDGVFEFLSSQAVIDMVAKYKDPRDACSAIVAESYKLWLEHENRTDDITVIIVHVDGLCSLS
ncbi:probable protein phosphatase 2C 35 [Amborella trichopoda]|uniref:probable protein phosphatase 2C 35 n=1 Tax=Amborella trichopoda TaxID=13333 RepID=UPI0009BCB379|nr:probable protein phosphatase 2C 35 [Amborella trichopoda]|eukprot:XP_020527029.1 probable protein phosphatase 2C 35 [Amborella trichopoda]